MSTIRMCPRCTGPLIQDDEDENDPYVAPFAETPGGEDIAVCMECASDEAVRFAFSGEMVPPHEWPIREGAHDHLHTHRLDPDRS